MEQPVTPIPTRAQARDRWRRAAEENGFSRQESARLLFLAWLIVTGRMWS
jgi:hypothetical protein